MKRVPKIISPWKAILLFTILFSCLTTPTYGIDITLQWNSNTEPDLEGYKVYYKTGSPRPPYRGTGAWEGESPIEVNADHVTMGNISVFTLTGLEDTQVYYFVVTAYDEKGFESGYSNEVCFTYLPHEPVIHRVIPNLTPPSQAGSSRYVTIHGLDFGQPQGSSMLHIGGNKIWSEGHPKIGLWSDTIIKITIPKYNCEWFGDREFRNRNIWVTVDSVDSNKTKLMVLKPGSCP